MSLDKSVDVAEVGFNQAGGDDSSEKKGTTDDQADMYRMGKSQQLRVRYMVTDVWD